MNMQEITEYLRPINMDKNRVMDSLLKELRRKAQTTDYIEYLTSELFCLGVTKDEFLAYTKERING